MGVDYEKKNEKLELCMVPSHPFAVRTYIELPLKILNKRTVLNRVNKTDNKYLLWCILGHKYTHYQLQNATRVYKYESYEEEIKLRNIECPVPLNKISKIEDLNDIRINVLGHDVEVLPLYIFEREDEDCINLLLVSHEDNYRYCFIRSVSRLLGDLTNHDGAHFYCYRGWH